MSGSSEQLPSKAELREDMQIEVLPNGETKGVIPDLPHEESDLPDFIRVYADDGRIGYVRKTDMFTPPPASPEEALRQQAAETGPKVLTVYGEDGTAVIGTFTEDYNEPVVE